MPIINRSPGLLAIIAAVAAAGAVATSARADQIVQSPQPPVVVIRSVSGVVTVARGDDGAVRLVGSDAATETTFLITNQNRGRIMLPAGSGLPTRRFTVPGVREGTIGVRIDNPGGDIIVYVPPRVSAVLVRADTGDVAASGFRGPYVIEADGGNVDLRRLFGFGHVRTTMGHVGMTAVGGNLHVETMMGTITGIAMSPERAEVRSEGGDIEWNFARLGGGPFRFTSGAGNVRVAIDGNASANIDAQSTQGSVVSRFNPGGNVRFRSLHAMSVSLGGGGPEITAASQSGRVEIGPRLLPHRLPRRFRPHR